jgi:hypothetical protein
MSDIFVRKLSREGRSYVFIVSVESIVVSPYFKKSLESVRGRWSFSALDIVEKIKAVAENGTVILHSSAKNYPIALQVLELFPTLEMSLITGGTLEEARSFVFSEWEKLFPLCARPKDENISIFNDFTKIGFSQIDVTSLCGWMIHQRFPLIFTLAHSIESAQNTANEIANSLTTLGMSSTIISHKDTLRICAGIKREVTRVKEINKSAAVIFASPLVKESERDIIASHICDSRHTDIVIVWNQTPCWGSSESEYSLRSRAVCLDDPLKNVVTSFGNPIKVVRCS